MGWQKRGIQYISKSRARDPLQNSECPTQTTLRRVCHHLPQWISPLLTVQFIEVIWNHTAQHIFHLWPKVSFGSLFSLVHTLVQFRQIAFFHSCILRIHIDGETWTFLLSPVTVVYWGRPINSTLTVLSLWARSSALWSQYSFIALI